MCVAYLTGLMGQTVTTKMVKQLVGQWEISMDVMRFLRLCILCIWFLSVFFFFKS